MGAAEGRVAVACGRDLAIDLELVVRARAVAHADERTPRFFKDGDGRFMVRIIVDEEHHRDWIEAQRHKIAEVGYQQSLALCVIGPVGSRPVGGAPFASPPVP